MRSASIVVSPGYSFLPDSYLLFLTGVTRVNPVEWDLPFSRFTKSVHDDAEIPFEAGTGCLEVARKVLSGRENEMVIETEPGLFEISDDGYVIRYAERRQIPLDYVERKEVPTGWLNVSSPELTAVDLIAYQDHVGGLTRAATVLEELSLKLDFSHLDATFLQVAPAPAFQRLGYLLDCVLEEESLADDLLGLMKSGGLKMKAVTLRLGASTEDRWLIKNGKYL